MHATTEHALTHVIEEQKREIASLKAQLALKGDAILQLQAASQQNYEAARHHTAHRCYTVGA